MNLHSGPIVLRCSPQMSDYLHDSGKTANLRHLTGKEQLL